jgi:hypothetical protein
MPWASGCDARVLFVICEDLLLARCNRAGTGVVKGAAVAGRALHVSSGFFEGCSMPSAARPLRISSRTASAIGGMSGWRRRHSVNCVDRGGLSRVITTDWGCFFIGHRIASRYRCNDETPSMKPRGGSCQGLLRDKRAPVIGFPFLSFGASFCSCLFARCCSPLIISTTSTSGRPMSFKHSFTI